MHDDCLESRSHVASVTGASKSWIEDLQAAVRDALPELLASPGALGPAARETLVDLIANTFDRHHFLIANARTI